MKSTYGAEAKFWAGGTDMMPLWQRESVEFDYYIDLTPLSELNFVEADENEIRIGAMATLGALDRASDPNNLTQELKNQAIGGAICGAGLGLCEGLAFDEETGEAVNAGLLDHKVLRTADFPTTARILFGDSYDPVGPFGASGAGEATISPPIPAISQASYNALGMWVDIPMTPERVLKALGRI